MIQVEDSDRGSIGNMDSDRELQTDRGNNERKSLEFDVIGLNQPSTTSGMPAGYEQNIQQAGG